MSMRNYFRLFVPRKVTKNGNATAQLYQLQKTVAELRQLVITQSECIVRLAQSHESCTTTRNERNATAVATHTTNGKTDTTTIGSLVFDLDDEDMPRGIELLDELEDMLDG